MRTLTPNAQDVRWLVHVVGKGMDLEACLNGELELGPEHYAATVRVIGQAAAWHYCYPPDVDPPWVVADREHPEIKEEYVAASEALCAHENQEPPWWRFRQHWRWRAEWRQLRQRYHKAEAGARRHR